MPRLPSALGRLERGVRCGRPVYLWLPCALTPLTPLSPPPPHSPAHVAATSLRGRGRSASRKRNTFSISTWCGARVGAGTTSTRGRYRHSARHTAKQRVSRASLTSRARSVSAAASPVTRVSPNTTTDRRRLPWRPAAPALAVRSQQAGAVVPTTRRVHHLYAARVLQASPAGWAARRAGPGAQGRHREAAASAARLRGRRRPRRWGRPLLWCRTAVDGTGRGVYRDRQGGRDSRRGRRGLPGGAEPAALSTRSRERHARADGSHMRGAREASGVRTGEGTEHMPPGIGREVGPVEPTSRAVVPAGDWMGPQTLRTEEFASAAAGASGPLHLGRGRLKPPGPPGLCRGRIGGGAAPDAPHATAEAETAEWAVSKPPVDTEHPQWKASCVVAPSSKVSIQARPRSLAAADSSIRWPPPDWNMSAQVGGFSLAPSGKSAAARKVRFGLAYKTLASPLLVTLCDMYVVCLSLYLIHVKRKATSSLPRQDVDRTPRIAGDCIASALSAETRVLQASRWIRTDAYPAGTGAQP
eukprot:scaffold5036_cov117-Isochrysis_galbana.AAC.5